MTKKIMLVCNAGVSTSMLAKRIEEASKGEFDVKAYGEAEYLDFIKGIDLILVGPQIRHLLLEIQKSVSVPVHSIMPQHYGMMNGKAVYEDIIAILKMEKENRK